MAKHTTITVPATRYEDHDDCLTAAADDISAKLGIGDYDMAPRWATEDREEIALDVPAWIEPAKIKAATES